MKNLLIFFLSIILTIPAFSESFKYFSVDKVKTAEVNFEFAEDNIKDLVSFYLFLRREFGKESVSAFTSKRQFTFYKNLNYTDFLHCLRKSKIKYDNLDLDIAKSILPAANLPETVNPVEPNIAFAREPKDNCLIEVDDTHIEADKVNNCDDCSTAAIPLQFSYNFCGSYYDELYINSNGNITFGEEYFAYNSIGIPNRLTAVMLAPFWADFDIRSCRNQLVTYKSEPNRFIITFNELGYYYNNCSLVNTFQVVITDGTDEYVGIGNNTAFYYGDMQWTTGDNSYGVNGFGGTPATVGINKNDGMSYAVIGRFNKEGEAYDGPEGEFDGVDYLDNKCFTFKSEDCTIDQCSISNLQVVVDVNCELDANGLNTGDYVTEVLTSGGVGELLIYGDVNSTSVTLVPKTEVVDNEIEVFVEDSFGCVSSASVAVPNCSIPEFSCTDGVQNGNETGIDCGGDCPNACASVCLNEPGSMQTSNSFVCGGKSVFVREAFSVVDENNVKAYVLHRQKSFDGSGYLAIQDNSRFYSPGQNYHNKPLYISAVIGPPGDDGFPVLNDPCTVWTSYGAYVVFFDQVDVNMMDEKCLNGNYYIDVQLSGGVGGVSPNWAYKTVTDGKKMYRNMSPDDLLSFGPYPNSGFYSIEAAGAKGCNGGLDDNYLCGGITRRLFNHAANSDIMKISYLDEDISIQNIELFNLKGQNIEIETSIDNRQAEIRLLTKTIGLYVVSVQLSNKEVDYIKILR